MCLKTKGWLGWIAGVAIPAVFFIGACTGEQKGYEIGILCGLDYISELPNGFRAKMAELGYTEGENIVYHIQHTNFEPENERKILEQFVEDRVDLILSCPTEASMLAKAVAEGSGIPVIFAFANTEGTGLVDSIRRPGGNITGVRYPGPDVALHRFEILLQIKPDTKAVLVPYQAGYPIVPSQLEALHPAAEARGVDLIEAPSANAEELQSFIESLSESERDGIDAILFVAEPLAVTESAFAVIAAFGAPRGIPCGGAMMSVDGYRSLFGANPDVVDSGREAAVQADRVLKGNPAGEIPIVSAEYDLEIDYGSARAFGLDVPEGLLSRANRIYR